MAGRIPLANQKRRAASPLHRADSSLARASSLVENKELKAKIDAAHAAVKELLAECSETRIPIAQTDDKPLMEVPKEGGWLP